MTTAAPALAAVVGALVTQPLEALPVPSLMRQVAAVARLVGRIPLEDLLECQQQMVLVAEGRDPPSLGEWVRHQIATHCEPVLGQQDENGEARRFLQTRREGDGSLRGPFLVPLGDRGAPSTVIEALARKQRNDDTRSTAQRRADALSRRASRCCATATCLQHVGRDIPVTRHPTPAVHRPSARRPPRVRSWGQPGMSLRAVRPAKHAALRHRSRTWTVAGCATVPAAIPPARP